MPSPLNPLRVLHVNAGNMYGGIERALTTFAEYRDAAPEMIQEFALCFDGRQAEELRAASVDVHLLGGVKFSRPWTVLAARKRFRSVLQSRRIDVVLTHGDWSHALFGPVARRAGLRLVNYVHGPFGGRHWLQRLARRTRPDQYIANSEYTASQVCLFASATPVAVVNPPVAPPPPFDRPEVRASVRKEIGESDSTVVVLQACRLDGWKGHEVLLNAAAKLKANPVWAVWIAGGPQSPVQEQYFERLKASTVTFGISNRVRFLGDRQDVSKLMAAADVFCQPNTTPEPFGIVYQEALQAGLPIVTSGFGGVTEIVDGSCAVLTEPGDVAAVHNALAELIYQPDRRRQMSAAGAVLASRGDPAGRLLKLAEALAATQLETCWAL